MTLEPASTDADARQGCESEEPPLVMSGVGKAFRSRSVLDDVSLTVQRGEVVGLVGRNGAGKSTLLAIASGLARPSAGRVDRNGTVAVLPEAPAFLPTLTGRQNLRLLGQLRARPSDLQVTELLQRVGLDPALKTVVGRYSQGMRQRLGVAQVLMEGADLVVLDEPANGLDPDGMRWLRSEVAAEASRGAAVIVSSHLLGELEKMCDRIVLLHQHQLVREWRSSDATSGASVIVRVRATAPLTEICAQHMWAVSRASDGAWKVDADLPTWEVVRALAAGGVDLVEVLQTVRSLETMLSVDES